MTDIVERLRAMPSSLNDALRTMEQAADEIERLRHQLSRHEWAESADRALMEEEIEQLRKDVQNLNRDCMMLAGDKHGTVRDERHARGADADSQRAPGDH